MAKDSDRRAYVREQIDFIRRSSDEDVHEVIIKAGLPDSNNQHLVTTVAQALQRRSLSTSPRDVLPIERRMLEEISRLQSGKSSMFIQDTGVRPVNHADAEKPILCEVTRQYPQLTGQ